MTLHLKSAMEYRTNFLVQSGFMFLNDALWIYAWVLVFSAFPTVNGYQFEDILIVFAVAAAAIGLVRFVFGHADNFWPAISEGRLDYFLAHPIDELFHVVISRSDFTALGDIIFGFGALIIVIPTEMHKAFVCVILAAVIYFGLAVMLCTTAFFVDRRMDLTRTIHKLIITGSTWPIDIFPTPARILLYAFPVAFMGAVPRHIITSFSWTEMGLLGLVAAGVLATSYVMFKIGLRRYESGNLLMMHG